MNVWAIAISVLAFLLGLGLGFGYFVLTTMKVTKPMLMELAPKLMALYEKDEQGFVLMGQRVMIGAVQHQIEAHGMHHKDDILAWLATLDSRLEAESKRRGEFLGTHARQQYDAEQQGDPS